MNITLPPFLTWLLIFFTLCFGVLYWYLTLDYDYWKKRCIPHEKPHFPFGNLWRRILGKESFSVFYRNFYDRFKGQRYLGFIMIKEPTLIVRDPGLIKQILVKDFSHFHDRGFAIDEAKDPISGSLFALQGTRWHALRSKLSPTFTSGKMKYMFPIVKVCAEHLQIKTASEMENGSVEFKDLMARYTTDVIGSAAFGVDAGALENPECEFRLIGRRVFAATLGNAFRSIMAVFAPSLIYKLGIKRVDPMAEDFFSKIVKETVTYREKNDVKRTDFLQLLLGMRNDAHEEYTEGSEIELTMNQMIAQCFVFFLGGFETSATTVTFTLYELSKNLDVQQKLREEVDRVLEEHGGEITYDGLAQMQYMDRVIAETLRKYPAVPFLVRECTKQWTIPSAEETGTDAREWEPETRNGGHVIEVGSKVHIPIIGMHYDPEFFKDPLRFDPERFTEEGRKKWHPFAYVPFGEGPRICIGMRFAFMQMKAGLAALLSKFEFRLSPKTADPLVLETPTAVSTIRGGLWLIPKERASAPK